MDVRRGRATESEGEAVWVVRDFHNPGWEKTSQSSMLCACDCLYLCAVCVHPLLGLGGNQQPQGATDAEGLGDHGFHLREGPEEQQVLVDGEDLPAYLQAGHLEGQTERQERKNFYF